MKDFDITLYGHLSWDNIFEDFNESVSLGCIANVWNELKKIDCNIKVKLVPTDIGESLILINKLQSKRTSISNLSLKYKFPKIYDSEINHIMYLNELKDTSFISKLSGFISADVCNGKKLNINMECLKYIDLLFISDEDLFYDPIELNKKIKGNVLLHHSSGSVLYTKNKKIEFKVDFIKNVNVLGMGDKFAAHVIYGILKNSRELKVNIQNAHDNLTKLLKYECKEI